MFCEFNSCLYLGVTPYNITWSTLFLFLKSAVVQKILHLLIKYWAYYILDNYAYRVEYCRFKKSEELWVHSYQCVLIVPLDKKNPNHLPLISICCLMSVYIFLSVVLLVSEIRMVIWKSKQDKSAESGVILSIIAKFSRQITIINSKNYITMVTGLVKSRS